MIWMKKLVIVLLTNLQRQLKAKRRLFPSYLQDMDLLIKLYMKWLHLINNPEIITKTFLSILSRWIQNTSTNPSTIPKISNDSNMENNKDNLSKNLLIIIDLKILQKINEDFKTDLVKNKKDVLLMIIRFY